MTVPQISLAFVGLVFALYLSSLAYVRFARRVPLGLVLLLALGQMLWLGALGWMAGSGYLLADVTASPPALLRSVVLPGWVAALALALLARRGPEGADWLVSLQGLRAPLALIFYGLYCAGALPGHLTFVGTNFDGAIGLLALPLGYWMHKGKAAPWLVWGFHGLGLASLLYSEAVSLLSAPTAWQCFEDAPGHGLVFRVPFVWLAGYVAPLAGLGHLLALLPARSQVHRG